MRKVRHKNIFIEIQIDPLDPGHMAYSVAHWKTFTDT